MDGSARTLFWFSDEDLNLEVPFFQRPYVWDEDNWNSLLDSINVSADCTMPFVGSFILQEKQDNFYWVIDGQQRITTFSLLIKALLDFYKDMNFQVRTRLVGFIYKTDGTNCDNITNNPRLTPAFIDKNDFDYLLNFNLVDTNDSEEIKKQKENELKCMTSKIADCYKFFTNYFKSLDVEKLKFFTSRLLTRNKYFIIITLDAKDDEQEIFDTVNSLGKRLTNSDIVKNYLYQKMKNFVKDNQSQIKQVLEHYKKYRDKVFYENERREFWDDQISLGRISTNNLDSFLKDFGTIKGIYMPSANGGFDGLAKQYKNFINTLTYEKLIEFSKELSSYADKYFNMKKEYNDCNDFKMSDYLNTTLLILDKLEISTFNPYVLQLVKTKEEAIINERLLSLQRFVIKRFLWKATIKNYNKVCTTLLTAENPDGYLESYNSQTNDVYWNEFPIGLKTIKNSQATLILFLIEMIRRKNNGENLYSDTMIYNKTLEHIMPQKRERNWSDVPSYFINSKKEYEIIKDVENIAKNRKSKIFSIGNMTLLSAKLNTSISNDCFKFKIEGKKNKGIKSFVGTISIAQEIVDSYRENPVWDERNIMDRELSLFDELNDYYNFVDDIDYVSDEETLSSINTDTFNNNYFENKKIGELVFESIKFLLDKNILTTEEINQLKDKDFSKKTLGCCFPVVTSDSNKIFDSKGRIRYRKTPLFVNDKKYYICKEFFEHDRKYFVPWLKEKLNKIS